MTLDEIAATLSAHDAGGDCASERRRLAVARERVAAELDTVLAHCAEGRRDLGLG